MGATEETLNQNLVEEEKRKKLIFTVKGNDQEFDFEQLGITFDSSENEILNSVQGIIGEANMSIQDDDQENEFIFTVRKSVNTETIYVYPKDPAGHQN